jgi:polyphosphate kinase
VKESPRTKKQAVKKSKPAPQAPPVQVSSAVKRASKKKATAPPAVAVGIASPPQFDLGDSQWYLNRELTWLEFNQRVLHEAEDARTPLLERLKFIAIVSANLDEFFMKRIGGLKQQIGAGLRERTLDGRTPRQQVTECHAVIRELEARKEQTYLTILGLLEEKNILIESYSEITSKEKKALREFYYTNIFPLLTPQSIDPAHPFPFISNLSLNLLVALRYPKARSVSLARVKVPVGLGTPPYQGRQGRSFRSIGRRHGQQP